MEDLKLSRLIDSIATEIMDANPSASKADIINNFFFMLENSVLPDVLRRMRPLPRPSPAQLKTQELRMRRIRRGKREQYKHLQYTYELANQFDYIKSQLDGHRLSDSSNFSKVFEQLSDMSTTPFSIKELSIEEQASSKWDGEELESFRTDTYKKPFIDRLFYEPWISSEEKKVIPEQFSFSILEPLQEAIVSDLILEKIVQNIETRMRQSFEQSGVKINLKLLLRQDQEIRDWEKIILSIDSEESDFDKKIALWEKIDSEIMEAIKEVEDKVNFDERTLVSKIKRKVFTDMTFSQ